MSHVPKFRKTFRIDRGADLQHAAVAIEAIHSAAEIGFGYLENIEPKNEATGFRLRSLHNLLARVFEHAQAMLVALSTGSAASSEVLARIVVEGSINIMYLATFGDAATIVKFFRHWIKEHDKKLSQWSAELVGESYARSVQAMIEERRKVVVVLDQFIAHVEKQCSIGGTAATAEWPNTIFKRFEALGRQTDYYESYHRLSGATHVSGEDTLTWLLARQMPPEQMQRMGAEAWAYSTMMTRIASTFFVDAVAACVIAHGRSDNNDIATCARSLWKSVGEIGRAAGVPDIPTDNI
jgi:hypothetical protein